MQFRAISPRNFGVELEVSNTVGKERIGELLCEFEACSPQPRKVLVTSGPEGWAKTDRNRYWHVKFDRTCGPLGVEYDFGWEIASYIASGQEDIDHISASAGYLSPHLDVTLNCGMHIHANIEHFTETEMGILLGRWIKVEHVLLSICHFCRSISEYCLPLRKRFLEFGREYCPEDPRTLWWSILPQDIRTHRNRDRFVTLNTVGYATYRINSQHLRTTVELRLPECRLDTEHVKNWIQLFLNFVESCKGCTSGPEDLSESHDIHQILGCLGLVDDKKMIILDENLMETKLWLLQRIIKMCRDSRLVSQAKSYLEFITTL